MGEDSTLKDVTLVAGIASNEFAPVIITKPFVLRGVCVCVCVCVDI